MVAGHKGVEYLIGLYAAAIVITAVTANKLVTFGSFTVPSCIIVFSVTFFLTDIISEFWGKKMAQKAVWAGFIADLLLLFAVWVAINWQAAPLWQGQEAFVQTLGTTARITFASLVAYIIAQSHDVWAFHFWKKKTKGKHLWIRNNFSTAVSQVIDSIIFIPLAFFGAFPIVPLIISNFTVKFVIAALDTPFIYLVKGYYTRFKPKALPE
ncbi:queuosine precursor transporter [Candidatus Woesearchaeota archaeon]|nr:queuosine precursor transporter [Candidatus Woesearchaeota archaeon]MBW3022144.1 queuosine precursor transporter [Candidatus Woesearchaeota archaeon]